MTEQEMRVLVPEKLREIERTEGVEEEIRPLLPDDRITRERKWTRQNQLRPLVLVIVKALQVFRQETLLGQHIAQLPENQGYAIGGIHHAGAADRQNGVGLGEGQGDSGTKTTAGPVCK